MLTFSQKTGIRALFIIEIFPENKCHRGHREPQHPRESEKVHADGESWAQGAENIHSVERGTEETSSSLSSSHISRVAV